MYAVTTARTTPNWTRTAHAVGASLELACARPFRQAQAAPRATQGAHTRAPQSCAASKRRVESECDGPNGRPAPAGALPARVRRALWGKTPGGPADIGKRSGNNSRVRSRRLMARTSATPGESTREGRAVMWGSSATNVRPATTAADPT